MRLKVARVETRGAGRGIASGEAGAPMHGTGRSDGLLAAPGRPMEGPAARDFGIADADGRRDRGRRSGPGRGLVHRPADGAWLGRHREPVLAMPGRGQA